MLKVENSIVMNFEGAIRGARNPMNSWNKMDSTFDMNVQLGKNDLELLTKLCKSGSDHRKFMRQILVCMDVTAPLYWWKEFDTYKVGTTANSTSTMHKIHSKPITIDDFSSDYLTFDDLEVFDIYLNHIEKLRLEYIATKDKSTWERLIQMLPSNYNQMRTITCSYENLVNMYHARKSHKLQEWHTFCDWVRTLPYANELIIGIKE